MSKEQKSLSDRPDVLFERLTPADESSDRLYRLMKMYRNGDPPPVVTVRKELSILWRRALWTWLWMKMPRAIEGLERISRSIRIAKGEK